jgi:hypothetical protein
MGGRPLVRRGTAVVAAVALLVGGCNSSGGDDVTTAKGTTAADPALGSLAYMTDKGLTIVAGGRQSVVAAEGVDTSSLAWSADGRFVAWLHDSGDYKRIAVHDTTKGTTTEVPTAGSLPPRTVGLVAVGNAFVTFDHEAAELHVVETRKATAARAVRTQHEPEPDPGKAAYLMASTGDAVVMSRPSEDAAAYGGPEDIFEVRLDGAVRRIARDLSDHNVRLGGAAVDPSGARVAYVSSTREGTCPGYEVDHDVVTVVDRATGRVVEQPTGPDAAKGRYWSISNLRYDRHGKLVAAFKQGPTECSAIGHDPAALYEVKDGRWVPLGIEATWIASSGGDGDTAIVLRPLPGGAGELAMVDTHGAMRAIDDGVTAVVVPDGR